jgi:hypothetical protein
MRTLIIAAVAAVGVSACASQQIESPAPAQPAVAAAFDPVGTYDFTTDVQGSPVRGTLVFRRDAEGGLTAVLASDATGEIVLQNIRMEGRRGEARAPVAPEGEMVMRFEFHEDGRLTGGYETTTGLSGSVAGQRRP